MGKLLLLILVRTCTDISFKKAVSHLHLEEMASFGHKIRKFLLNPFTWLGLFFGVSNVIVWMMSLKEFDLSYAYPFLSISYVTIIICGKFFFKEHLDRQKLLGMGFICLGAVLLFLG